MPEAHNKISTILFNSYNVSVFKIPPGKASLNKWTVNEANIVWRGELRAIEQESIAGDAPWSVDSRNETVYGDSQVTEDATISQESSSGWEQKSLSDPYRVLQLKLELYNTSAPKDGNQKIDLDSNEQIWAEVWFNPLPSDIRNVTESSFFGISKDGGVTISATPESTRYYKIISQIPGTGCQLYHPSTARRSRMENKEPLQVALGLKFEDAFDAVSFADALKTYRRRFDNLLDQYDYELKSSEIQRRSQTLWIESDIDTDSDESILLNNEHNEIKDDNMAAHNINETEKKGEMDETDDEEFGDFVENS